MFAYAKQEEDTPFFPLSACHITAMQRWWWSSLSPRHSNKPSATGLKLQSQRLQISVTIYLVKSECPEEYRRGWASSSCSLQLKAEFFCLDSLLCRASCLIPFKLCASSLAFWFNVSPKGCKCFCKVPFNSQEAQRMMWDFEKVWRPGHAYLCLSNLGSSVHQIL